MKVRLAQEADLPALMDIYNQSILARNTAAIDPVDLEDRLCWFNEHSPTKHPILVATKKQEVMGYISLSAYRPGRAALSKSVEVSYFVGYDYHRQGVASTLMQAVIDQCPELGIKNLFAILLENNLPSVGLLKKFGFEQWAYLPKIAELEGVELSQVYYGLRIEN